MRAEVDELTSRDTPRGSARFRRFLGEENLDYDSLPSVIELFVLIGTQKGGSFSELGNDLLNVRCTGRVRG